MSNTAAEDNHQHHHHHRHFHQQPQHQQQQQQQPQQQQQQHSLPAAIVSTTIITTTAVPVADIVDESPRVGDALEQHCRLVEEELQNVRESETRVKQQYADAQRRERMLIRRLAAKEQEMQDYATQNIELKAAQAPTQVALRQALLDPAVNILFHKIKAELQSTKARLEETQNELSAWKFTPDSNTGKRLMAKCRLLYQENEELGKMTTNGRLAKLEGDLALQKSFSEEVKKSQSELDDFLQELDEDVEGMQSTILFLQQELKLSKDTIATLERENCALKNGGNGDLTTSAAALAAIAHRDQSITDNNNGRVDDLSIRRADERNPPADESLLLLFNGKKMPQVASAYAARNSGGVTVLATSALTGDNSNTDGNDDDDVDANIATATTTIAHYNHNSSLNNNCSDRFLIKDCPTKLLINSNSSSLGNSSSAVTSATAQEPNVVRTLRSSSRLTTVTVDTGGKNVLPPVNDHADLQQQRAAKLAKPATNSIGNSSNGSGVCLNIYDDQQQQQQQPQPQRRPNGGTTVDEPINYTHNYPPRKGYKRTYVPPVEHHLESLENDITAVATATVNSSQSSLSNTNKIINDSVLDYNNDATNLTVNSNNNNNSNNSNNKDGRIVGSGGAKKQRRSSVLSLDLNNEDGRIDNVPPLDQNTRTSPHQDHSGINTTMILSPKGGRSQARGGLTDASSSTANGAV